MRKTENYEFNLPDGTDPAEIEKINENMEELDRILAAFLLRAHPIGSLYWSSDSTDPAALFGGTWVQITDKFILAAGRTYFEGTTGGNADAIVVSHQHDVSGTAESAGSHTHPLAGTAIQNGGHTHPLSGLADNAGAHRHGLIVSGAPSSSGSIVSNSGTAYTSRPSQTALISTSQGNHVHTLTGQATNAGAHSHSLDGTATAKGAHTHTVSGTTANAGESGTGKNMPPYIVKYCWERTA